MELNVSLVLRQKQVLLRICKPLIVPISKADFCPSLFTQGLVCPSLSLLHSMLLQTALLLKEYVCVFNTILYNWADLAPRNYYNFIKQNNLQNRLSSVKGSSARRVRGGWSTVGTTLGSIQNSSAYQSLIGYDQLQTQMLSKSAWELHWKLTRGEIRLLVRFPNGFLP